MVHFLSVTPYRRQLGDCLPPLPAGALFLFVSEALRVLGRLYFLFVAGQVVSRVSL